MEAINDASKLVARSIEVLKDFDIYDVINGEQKVADVIVLLEEALEKLINGM